MSIREKFERRFAELDEQMTAIPSHRSEFSGPYFDEMKWQQWATSAMSLLQAAFGENSPHVKNFQSAYGQCSGYEEQVKRLMGVFNAAKADFDGGYVFSLEGAISGEVLGDFVVLSKAVLQEGNKDVAAVLACAALEDALKRYAILNGLDVDGKEMQEVVKAIKAKGLVSGAQKTLLDSMPKIRNYAMHANWEKITAQDVGGVIGFVEQFLLVHFSQFEGRGYAWKLGLK